MDEIKVYADMRMRTIAAAFLPPWLEVMALRREVDHLTKRLAHERERANAAEAALEDMIEAGAFEPSPGVTIHIAGDVIGDLVIGS